MTFGEDNVVRGISEGKPFTMEYKIEGDVLSTLEADDGQPLEWKPHTYMGVVDGAISFSEEEGGVTTFYYAEADAIANPNMDCGEEEMILSSVDGIVSGTVRLINFADAGIDMTNLAVRIIPTSLQGQVLGLSCQVFMNSDNVTGSYGSSCRTWDNPELIIGALNPGETFEFLVYRDDTDPSHISNPGDYVFGGTMETPLLFSEITGGAEFLLEHHVPVSK